MIATNLIPISGRFSVVALNYILPSFFDIFWNRASLRLCGDGGANQVLQFFDKRNLEVKSPHVVVGDLDSIKDSTKKHFEQFGTDFVFEHDQDFNDLQKCLKFISKHNKDDPVIILGVLGGRFDHHMSAISATLERKELNTVLVNEENIVKWILPGSSKIIPPKDISTGICGIIPLAGPVSHIKTEGLKWNLDFGISIGSLISTSNVLISDVISIRTTDPVIWTNEIDFKKKQNKL